LFNGYYQDNLEIDPQFALSGEHPYSLKPESPAINQGQNITSIGAFDFAGNQRIVYGQIDMGAYEFCSTKPIVLSQDSYEIMEDTPFTLPISKLDIIGGAEAATYSLKILPGLNYSANEDGLITPSQNFYGSLNVNYQVYDQNNYSDSYIFNITINPVNDAPQINLPETISFVHGEEYVLNVDEYISDIDNFIDDLAISINGQEQINTFIDGFQVHVSAIGNFTGSELLTVLVNDQMSKLIASDTVRVIVTGSSNIQEEN